MKVIKPVVFTNAMLLSTTATETIAAYIAGTTYATDDEVNYSNSIYVSLQDTNLGNQPDISPTYWIRKSANNTYSMFDEFVNTQTTMASSLSIVLQPGVAINSLSIFNMTGTNTLHAVLQDGVGGTTVYDTGVVSLDDTIILDWYMYFYEPYDLRSDVILQDIPAYMSGVLTVSFTGTATLGIGNFVFGSSYYIGMTQYGASAGIIDYSTKDTNVFGITNLVKRAFSKKMTASLYIESTSLRFVRKLLEDLRATPVVWIGSDDDTFDSLSVYGYYKDFNMEISYPTYVVCSLEVEGLI